MELRPLSRMEVLEIDRRASDEFGLADVVLMENAGRASAQWLVDLGITGPVLICCGKGNNGGDGFVFARHLDAWGFKVRILLACRAADLTGPARTNFQILATSQIPMTPWSESPLESATRLLGEADWVIDGLLGTGIRGEVREPFRTYIGQINACRARKLAIDIPSGLDCDLGIPMGCAVRADFTATFVAIKLGFTRPESAPYVGQVRAFDIGLPACLLREFAR